LVAKNIDGWPRAGVAEGEAEIGFSSGARKIIFVRPREKGQPTDDEKASQRKKKSKKICRSKNLPYLCSVLMK
jgi:hypothetical protein